MPHTLDQILPSLQSLGVLGYWLIGLASALEAFFLTGVVVPGTLIVDAGGILVQRGLLDYFDLAWFVAIGSVLGSEMSYWTGRIAMDRIPGRKRIEQSDTFARASRLFEKRGGAALIIGRFLGPVAGLVPLAAAMSGMDRRKFLIWNILGSIPYALVHVGIGYFMGDVIGRIGGSLTRMAVLAAVVALLLAVLWGLLYSALRLLPLALTILTVVARSLRELPGVSRWMAAHPGVVGWVAARFDRSSFSGLPLTLLGVVFVYIATVWMDSAVDFLSGDPMVQIDMRLAELLHHFRAAVPVQVASVITATGGWQVVTPVVLATVIWLMLKRRHPLAIGVLVTAVGNTFSVALLKMAFARPRSPLGYFTETSGSFPSGHAAGSVAVYGMLMYVLWRTRKLRAETALLAAGLVAFAIGVSRIYLVEHYLSDVLNGWLVGLLWVMIGVAVSEWLKSRSGTEVSRERVGPVWRVAGMAGIVLLVGLAAFNVWRYDHPINALAPTADVPLSNVAGLSAVNDLPTMTESLLGSRLRPISLVVLARDEAALSSAMLSAGWTASKPPSAGLIVDALYSAVAGDIDPTVGTVAHFWRNQPADLGFMRAPDGTSGQTYRARFWRTEFVTPDGKRVFVAAAGVDEVGGTATGGGGQMDATVHDMLVKGLVAQGSTSAPGITLPGIPANPQAPSMPPAKVDVLALP